jgi:hypothetical protein
MTLVGLPLYAWRVRGRAYAIFGLVILAVSLPGAVAMHARLLAWAPAGLRLALAGAFAYGMAAAGTHLAALVRARLRPALFRLLVSIPGMVFIAAGALSGVWLLVLLPVRALLEGFGWQHALAMLRGLDLVPFVIVAGSIVTSARLVPEVVRVPLATEGPPTVSRVPVARYRRRRPSLLAKRPLRILQIADPHLGPWQPVRTLERRLTELVAREPDLVLLTGDFLTMEGIGTPGALAEALAPLRPLARRAFAILGNHDHGCEEEVETALAVNGIRLLVDEEALVDSPIGPVQIVGADYVGRGCREHIQHLVTRHPRRAGHLRLLLLHDPRVFRHIPPGDVDLTLSGHTHGGQLGLLSLGLNWTVLSRSAWPDHGLFGHGASRLYVHRGTGFYGFPLRIGVPGEASILEVVPSSREG